MFDFKGKVANFIYNNLQKIGLDPIYTFTIICIVISAIYLKDIKNWDRVNFSSKLLVGSTFFGTFIAIILSLLKLLNIVAF